MGRGEGRRLDRLLRVLHDGGEGGGRAEEAEGGDDAAEEGAGDGDRADGLVRER